MTNKDLINRVTTLVTPICQEVGVSLWDVTFEKEGRAHVLSIYIDKKDGIYIEDCEKVSRAIDPCLDAKAFDSLPPYTLTVSSAGLERRLTKPEHFQWAQGKKITLTFYKSRDGQSELSAILKERSSDGFELILDNEECLFIAAADVASARIYFAF